MLVRTLSGIALCIVVLCAVLLSKWSCLVLMLTMGVGCLWEFYALARKIGYRPQQGVGIALCIALILNLGVMFNLKFLNPHLIRLFSWQIQIAGAVAIFAVAVYFSVKLFHHRKKPFKNGAVTMLGVCYTAIPMILLFLSGYFFSEGEYTPRIILSYILIVWSNDIGAYLVGVPFGKHRLCQRISPLKSWEGFFGGIAVAIGVATLAGHLLGEPLIKWAVLGLIVAVTGVAGDLVESMLKREAGVKDSGRLLPGHGGFLDRFDALLCSAPFLFTYLYLFP